MFILKLKDVESNIYQKLPNVKFIIYEFDITSRNMFGYLIDEAWFCKEVLGNYPVDKYRVTLKRKFHAKGHNDGKGPMFFCGRLIKPMVFEKLQDAEEALEWVESIQIQAMLAKN